MNKTIFTTQTKSNPVNLLFASSILTGILISLSAHSWFTIWIGLELNLFGFIPLIITSNKNQEKEAACKYFLAQAAPSAIFLLCLLLVTDLHLSSLFLTIALLIKMGIAPCHQWFPSVINSLPWIQAWILITVQKIAPFFLLIQTINNSPILTSIVAGLSSIVGGIGGINQTLLRPLIAYSSIGHIGWILRAILVSNRSATLYFISYLLIVSTTIFRAILLNLNSIAVSTKVENNPILILFLILSFINIGGLPPFFGFFIKATIINHLLRINFFLLTLLLILGSVINLFYYLKIVFINTLRTPTQLILLYSSLSTTPKPIKFNTSYSLINPFLFILSTSAATTTLLLFRT